MFFRSLYVLITFSGFQAQFVIWNLSTPPSVFFSWEVKTKWYAAGSSAAGNASTLRESPSEISEISNFVKNCGERPQGEEASQKASAVILVLDLGNL